MSADTLTLEPRFRGPPHSANGGYVCGRLAAYLAAEVVTVRLHRPPPLGRDLEVRPTEKGVGLFDGDSRIAEARLGELALPLPEAPSFESASAATDHYRGFEVHPYPGCFVCGPKRAEGDGLRIFPSPLGSPGARGSELVAAPWIPGPELASEGAEGGSPTVASEMIWAALDCPGGFAFPHPDSGAILLGELTARILAPVGIGEHTVVVGWEVEADGRKHHTGTALYGADGQCRALALGTWFEVPMPS